MIKLFLSSRYSIGCLFLTLTFVVQAQTSSKDLSALLTRAAAVPAAQAYDLALEARTYPLEAFDQAARQQLAALLLPTQAQLEQWVLLAGFAGLETPLRQLLTNPDLAPGLKQPIRLALARCGDQLLLAQLMARVRKMPINNAFVYQVAPLLVYVRQPQSVAYLLEIILLDETNCTPADAETPGAIPCGYRLMELVTPIFDGFPLRLDPDLGQLMPPNYPAALQQTRQWIQSLPPGTYPLRRHTY